MVVGNVGQYYKVGGWWWSVMQDNDAMWWGLVVVDDVAELCLESRSDLVHVKVWLGLHGNRADSRRPTTPGFRKKTKDSVVDTT